MKKLKIFILIVILILVIIIPIFLYNRLYSNYIDRNDTVNEEVNNEEVGEEKTLTVSDLLKEEDYYIDKNLERYLSYIEVNSDLSYEEVITRVNSNIDYEFYTNVVSSDTKKDTLVLVNKYHKLDSDYVPNLVKMESGYTSVSAYMEATAYEYYKQMVDAAKSDGIKIYNVSAYRSYSTQSTLYNNYKNRDGQELADTYSARAGYSEHQTGLASDINTASSSANFQNTKEYEWLQNNSYKYGFIMRYPKDKEYITGYKYEPWHYRYVGVEVSTYIHNTGITFEEYYAYFIED